MWLCYLIALFPALIGGALWVKYKSIVWWEWGLSALAGFVLSGLFHVMVVVGMTSDTETWSGQIISATYHPWWKAEWMEWETYTDSKGKSHSRLVTKTKEHPEHWTADASYGSASGTKYINQDFFKVIVAAFGYDKPEPFRPGKPNLVAGDPNDYGASNRTGYVFPVTTAMSFENRIKAAPSLFSFSMPEQPPANCNIFEYPQNSDWTRSDRLLGTASEIGIREWDVLNAELGPGTLVNLMAVGFGPAAGSDTGRIQEAKWIGGKKNDLVMCYGGGTPQKPTWAYCFGWTEEELVKKNLESIFLQGPVDASIIPKIRAEVVANYRLKDWTKFDYITIEPPTWAIMVLVAVMAIVQCLVWAWAFKNEEEKIGLRS